LESYNDDGAMAALHVVSAFLFDGGKGSWDAWLKVACIYANSILYHSRFHGPADALIHCSVKDAFIIKTAMWFDVLGSVTTRTSPYFLRTFRQIFHPHHSGIHDPSPRLSMLDVMGCESHIVWAMAETSDLAAWKQRRIETGSLSVPDLVTRAKDIEASLSTPHAYPHAYPTANNDKEWERHQTAEIFRTSTRVYLRSVVSGDYPGVREIVESVEEAIVSLSEIPHWRDDRSVVRSTVYGIFVCGCLTDHPSHRDFLRKLLQKQGAENVGNCSSVQQLLECVWDEWDHGSKRAPVRWRELLKDSKILLV
jgi:hypothetical protein